MCGVHRKTRTENRSVCLSGMQKKRVCCIENVKKRESEVRVQRVNETFVVAEWRQEGGSGQGSTGTRNSTRRGEEETSERLVRMCAVPFQHVPEWCQRTSCVNTPYGTTCRGVFSLVLQRNINILFYVCSHRGDIRQKQKHIIIIYTNFPTGL